MPTLDRVISVACADDLQIWTQVHPHIVGNIPARHYCVIVPRSDLSLFRANTGRTVEVIDETAFLDRHDKESITALLPQDVRNRAGWYLQQFAKISAAREGDSQSVNLIWDADTLPIRRLNFFGDGKLYRYGSREAHAPYYTTLDRILGIETIVRPSFIAQCLAVRKSWVDEFCAELEHRWSTDWISAILERLPGRDGAEFSEYEAIGNFVEQRHPHAYEVLDSRWVRFGYSRFGAPENLSEGRLEVLSRRYDFISFEKWDRNKSLPSRLLRALKSKLAEAHPSLSKSQP